MVIRLPRAKQDGGPRCFLAPAKVAAAAAKRDLTVRRYAAESKDAGVNKKEILELSKETNSVSYLIYNEQLYIENVTK